MSPSQSRTSSQNVLLLLLSPFCPCGALQTAKNGPSTYLPAYLLYLHTYSPTYPPTYSTCIPTRLPTRLPTTLSTHPPELDEALHKAQ